jgi:D-arabinose 5-phosphate isomerase GutQ
LLALAEKVLSIESGAVDQLKSRLDESFVEACHLCRNTDGRVVVTGMGKSGHIGGKIAATLASTGTPSFFMHPAEASHGDLGMITANDILLAVSYSGETQEVVTILPLVKRMGAKLISMTGKPGSTLANAADVHLDVSVSEEACPLNLAPTWGMRWQSRSSKVAASRKRTSRCRTRVAALVNTWITFEGSRMLCAPATRFRPSMQKPVCGTASWRCPRKASA